MRVIVKIGTSSLTSESGEVNVAALSKLVDEVVMARAQGQFHQGGERAGARGASAALDIDAAYAALGVDSSVSDRELKRAYRKRMSENHPDKLIARGVPEDMVRLATERSQEIQSAYEQVRRQRGIRK